MSSMAKIFVVVNLLLVVAVFGSAATLLGAADDYRVELGVLTTQARETQDRQEGSIKDLRGKLASQVQKTSNEKSRADDAEARLEIANAGLGKAQQANAAKDAAFERLTATLEAFRGTHANMQATMKALQDDAQEASRNFVDKNKAWEEVVRTAAASDMRVTELDDSVRSLQANLKKSEDALRQCQFWLSKMEERYGKMRSTEASEGKILEVRDAAGGVVLVIVSVGRDDKVRVGDEFRISRGNVFVGFAKVTRVFKDKAVAEFDTQFTGPGQAPRNGDRAYTR